MPRHLLRRQPADPDLSAPRRRPHHAGATQHVQPQTTAQFQTPPSRGPPPEAAAPAAPAAGPGPARRHSPASAQAAIFSLFGRGIRGRGRGEMMDEDEEEEEGDIDESGLGGRLVPGTYGESVQLADEEEDEEEEVNGDEEAGLDSDAEAEGGGDEEAEGEAEDEDEMMQDRAKSPSPSPPLPTNLREISSLASWTVSTHKPSFGVTALRHPAPTQYWQSDGPQPHTLTLHFFKLVAIVKIRVYLNFELDESYTPTKMTFLAGMGGNDLVEFSGWEGDAPVGWVDVPLEGVGGCDGGWVGSGQRKKRKQVRRRGLGEDEEEEEDSDDDEDEDTPDDDDEYAGNVLKAMVLQMRVIENHQNGKDTHVRGFQVFAKDDERRRIGAPSASADSRIRRHSARKSLRKDEMEMHIHGEGKTGLDEPDWMGEPVIR